MDMDYTSFLPSFLESSESDIGDPEPVEPLVKGLDPSKPIVFTINLGTVWQRDLFQSTHNGLLNALFDRSNVLRASTTRQMLALFDRCPDPHAVLVTDPGLFREGHAAFLMWLITYARRGGIVVFGGIFASGIRSQQLNSYFRYFLEPHWAISDLTDPPDAPSVLEACEVWRYRASGSGHELKRNSRALVEDVKAILPESFRCSEYARFFSRIAPQHAWYLPAESVPGTSTVTASQTSLASEGSEESGNSENSEISEASDNPENPYVSAAEGQANESEPSDAPPTWNHYMEPSKWTKSPFVYGDLGRGKIGFVGDYNSDCPEATFNITLAMLRLFPSSDDDQSSSPLPAPSS